MDDLGHPSRWWARLLFEPRQLQPREWWLGLVVIGVLLGGAWLIFWPYLPQLIVSIFQGIGDLFTWVGNLFSGGSVSPQVVATPPPLEPTIVSTPAPSPFASPSPFRSPSPFPSPSALPR